MTGTAPASAQRQDGDTLGGVPGAPAPARAAALVARAVTGADSAPVTMTAPFTGKPIIALPQATDPEVRAAFDDARAAQRAWAATAVAERQRILVRLQDLVLDRQREGLDLVQVETGKARMDAFDEESDYVGFTGSTATGKRLAGQIAERLTSYSLELGGKNPMIVLPDAKIESAATGAVGACFSSAGQLCVSVERIYVHESIRERFTEAFVNKTKGIKLGAELDFSAGMGSLTSEEQLETIAEHVDDAKAKGATVLAGGKPRPDLGPYFYEPTVLADVTPDMKPFAEETFGPVVSIYGYTDLEDAINRANDTIYGLNASVWTADGKLGREVAARIHAGTVNVNEGFAATFGSVDAPMGGVGDSGVGRRNGAEGILRYTEVQTIATQRGLKLRPFRGMPPRLWAKLMSVGVKALRRLPR